MARDYNDKMKGLIASDKKETLLAAVTFQTKVTKALEGLLKSREDLDRTRTQLAAYTASHAAYGDLTKIMEALRAQAALATFKKALPERISKLDDAEIDRITALLDTLRKADASAPPFALALVAQRLTAQWQLINLAIKGARSKSAADIAVTPNAIAVSMVLDQIDDKRQALRIALKNNRVVAGRDILIEIYNAEHALRIHIRELDESEWGNRLRTIMDAIAILVAAEADRFPGEVGHILTSRSLRRHDTLAGRLSSLAWKARDAFTTALRFAGS